MAETYAIPSEIESLKQTSSARFEHIGFGFDFIYLITDFLVENEETQKEEEFILHRLRLTLLFNSGETDEEDNLWRGCWKGKLGTWTWIPRKEYRHLFHPRTTWRDVDEVFLDMGVWHRVD